LFTDQNDNVTIILEHVFFSNAYNLSNFFIV